MRRNLVELAQLQPLAGEVLDEALRAVVGEHPLDLCREHGGLVQLAGRGYGEQLVVGDAAPEEEREPRGELEVAERVDAAGRDVGGLALEPIEEVRIDEQPRQRVLDAGSRSRRLPPALAVELEQQLNLGAGSVGTGRRYARVARRVRISPAHGASAAAEAGRQTKISRRLGVSPVPVGVVRPADHEPLDGAADLDLAGVELVDAGAAPLVDERDA